ncbi:MAG TPA: hypothetical protein VIP70_07270 [Nitrososphaeraceae archaeon]
MVIDTNKKVYNCFYCSAPIFFDGAVRSEKTNKRLPLNLEDASKHECAHFILSIIELGARNVNNYSSVSKIISSHYPFSA